MRAEILVGGVLVVGCGTRRRPDYRPEDACRRRILESHVTSAREGLGGSPVAEGTVSCGRVLRGGALAHLARESCVEFSQLGVSTLVDLGEQGAQDKAPPPACAAETAEHVSAPLSKLLPDTPENDLALMNEAATVRHVFSILSSSASYPVHIHGEIGRDRVSFASTLVLLALGAPHETVIDELLLSDEAGVAVKGECASAVLDEVVARGGTAAYLQAVGVDSGALDGLRRSVIEEAP